MVPGTSNSLPVMVAAVLYALATVVGSRSVIAGPPPLLELGTAAGFGLSGGAALLAGIALGMIRERSLSLWPAFVAAVAAVAARVAVELF